MKPRTSSSRATCLPTFSLWGSRLKAGSERLQLHRCLVGVQEEQKPPLCRMPLPPPCPRPTFRQPQSRDKPGTITGDSDTHSLGEIIMSLNEFKLPKIKGAQVRTRKGAGQCSRCFSFRTTNSHVSFSIASHCHFQLFMNTGKESIGT